MRSQGRSRGQQAIEVAQSPLPAYVWAVVDDVLTLVDSNAAAIAVEPAVPDLYGLTVDELERDSPAFAGILRRALAEQTVHVTESPYTRRSDGAQRHLIMTCVWTAPATVIAHVLDVTERREREQALTAANELFRAAFEDSPLGSALISVDPHDPGRLVEVNAAFCRVFGRSREQLVGAVAPAAMSYPPDLTIGVDELGLLVSGELTACSFEKRFLDADGGIVWGTIWMSLVGAPRGGPRLALCHLQDTTERRNTEAALRASEARCRQIVETTSEGVWLVDADSRTTFVNARMAEMLGYTVEEMLGTTLERYQVDGMPAPVQGRLHRRRPGVGGQHELTLRRRDGSELSVRISHDALCDDGVHAGALAMMSDITERTRAERELREAKLRFEGAFAQAPTGMAIVSLAEDSFGVLLQVNVALCALLEHSQEAIVGRTIADLTHPDDAASDTAHARGLLTGELARYESEKRLIAADGHVVPVHVSAAVARGEDGEILYGIAHIQDVTARRRAEAEVEERERRFRGAFSLALDAMLIADDDGRWVEGNRAAADLLGIDVAEIAGRRLQDFTSSAADDVGQMWRRFLAEGESVGECDIVRPDGEVRNIEFSARANFTPGRHLSILRDMTERKRSAEAREESRQEADRLEAALHQAQKLETVGQLAGGVAHDFNNILAVILNSAEFALAELDGHAAADDVRAVREAAQRAAQLTRQLLVFSRQEIAEPQVLGLNGLVCDVERLLRRTIGQHIDLRVSLGPEEPTVEADPSHLEQVVLNLAVNARDAMPDGGTLLVKTAATELDANYARERPGVTPGRYAMLVVSDTGHGMSAEVLAKVFEPFFTTKEKGSGTGLGLATVYGIVKQNGGHIALYSEKGEGTVARVYLPLADRAPDPPAAAEPDPPRAAAGEKVLVVEDEEGVRRITERILEQAGYSVLCAACPQAALELAARMEFDVVLTDVVMPVMSGPQLVARLRARRPGLRALFTSGYTDRPGALPADDVFLSKPFSRRTLLEQVAQVLNA